MKNIGGMFLGLSMSAICGYLLRLVRINMGDIYHASIVEYLICAVAILVGVSGAVIFTNNVKGIFKG